MQTCSSQRSLRGPCVSGTTPRSIQRPVLPCQHHMMVQQRSRALQSAQGEAPTDDFGSNVKRIAKKIQGALPVIGLLSRLASPEGGFDEIAYPEYCRTAYDTADERFRKAHVVLEQRYGKMARTRWTLLVLWMAVYGVGVVPSKDIMAAARRIRVSQDAEVEVDRFEGARDAVLKKYTVMERPRGKVADQLAVACDGLCTVALGLKDGQPVAEADQPLVMDILRYAFPLPDDQLAAAVAGRTSRASAYA